ncbi:hypothetical protein SAMN05660484_00049 [Eubacterium ruminantium]|uniref:Uncharacterized protein n=2 Tax=Eubacterium ruminantium TaxID=42322 RepID=A0A1T4KA07_9FIRM|nr:hypothetical protein SAMN05660484_00049 [Eubacterium ruminantium]SDM17384.1 hypothetical protein SAMN04490370_101275 [Eubacterium ruminantium]SJZ39153.1 hypothetical protein SAMN02745110_00281 [Eubacterium ruminantium]
MKTFLCDSIKNSVRLNNNRQIIFIWMGEKLKIQKQNKKIILFTIILFAIISVLISTGKVNAKENTGRDSQHTDDEKISRMVQRSTEDDDDEDEDEGDENVDLSGRKSFDVKLDVTADRGKAVYVVDVKVTCEYDFNGYIRLKTKREASDTMTYDYYITLPASTEKSLSINVPFSDGDYFDTNNLTVQIVNKKDVVLFSQKHNDIFREALYKYMYIGALSNSYKKLSYLEATGSKINRMYNMSESEGKLVEITPDNLISEISKLDMLFIDDFDTSTLSPEQISAIEDYVYKGGSLVIGTGKNLDSALKGFGKSFIKASCSGLSSRQYQFAGKAIQAADIRFDTGFKSFGSEFQGAGDEKRRGYIYISNYSFSDPVITGSAYAQSYIVDFYNMLDRTEAYRIYDDGVMSIDMIEGFFRNIEGLSSFESGGLKIIIVLYVLIIGPVLYLLLKKSNKREFFWVAIPAVTAVFMVGIMIYGRRFMLEDKKAASVTIASANGSGQRETFLSAYSTRDGKIEFKTRSDLNAIDTVGYDYYGRYNSNRAVYRAVTNGDDVTLIHEGKEKFDKGYFHLKLDNEQAGNIHVTYNTSYELLNEAKIENNTKYDFKYFLILRKNKFIIVNGCKKGGVSDVAKDKVYTGNYVRSQSVPSFFGSDTLEKNLDVISCLYLGANAVYDGQSNFVIGVTENYERITKGDISENSYGVIYDTVDNAKDK